MICKALKLISSSIEEPIYGTITKDAVIHSTNIFSPIDFRYTFENLKQMIPLDFSEYELVECKIVLLKT